MSENRNSGHAEPNTADPLISGLLTRASYRAQWTPVYIEPIPFSGESLTCGVAVVGMDGDVRVVSAFTQDMLLRCFGEAGRGLYNTSSLILADLEMHLKARAKLESWQPVLQGIRKGPLYTSQDVSIEAIAKQALHNKASFSAKQAEKDQDDSEDDAPTREWRRRIRDIVSERAPMLKDRFDLSVPISLGISLKIGFAGSRLAANFTRINPNNITQSLQHAKSRMVDVGQLRDFVADMGFAHHELILQQPTATQNNLSATQKTNVKSGLVQLEGFCKKHGIDLVGCDSPDEAAAHICEREAQA